MSFYTGVVDIEDRQPCWYAVLEEKRWVVGLKHPIESDQKCEIKINADKDLDFVFSKEFAIGLINAFKSGGTKLAKKYYKEVKL